MQALLEKVMGIFEPQDGTEIEDGIDEIYGEIDEEPVEIEKPTRREKNIGVVRPINSKGYEVMVVSPKTFDESLEISKNLIERKTIVMNLELLSHEDSQRVVDFLAGATFALNGHQQKIGDGVFIFTPTNVNISAEAEKKTAASITDAFWSQIK